MAKFLITGARAPVALELARNLSKDGHTVYMADSLRFPLARCSNFVKQTFRIAAPRLSLSQFKNDLQKIIKDCDIDLIIPTCEEVFYISAIKSSLEVNTKVFCPEFTQIKSLHSKYHIYYAAQNTGFSNPNTEILSGQALLARNTYAGKVVKKEFCRFGTDVLIEPDFNEVSALVSKQCNDQFVIQDKIEGIEYCTYAIAHKGQVYYDSIYTPKHRMKMAAGIYFKPIVNENISKAIKVFCDNNNITGQIGFDVIQSGDKIFLLECNPRATSGLHLLTKNTLSQAFLGYEYHLDGKNNLSKAKMVKLAMLLIGLPVALRNNQFKQWQHDYRIATDVLSVKKDRSLLFFSVLALFEISAISLKTRRSFRAASTFDIEWDGEEIDV